MTIATPWRDWRGLPLFVLAVAAAAGFGGVFLPGEWYQALVKPAWTPPNWLFGPVWGILYVMIAVAGWLAWRAGARRAVVAWAIGLVLNALWSWLFFGQRMIGAGLVDIVALVAAIGAFVMLAWPSSRGASLLFVPYLAWVSFATALNAAIFVLNR